MVSDQIQIAFFCIELDRESTRVAGRVCGTLLTADGGYTDSDFGLLSDFAEQVCGGLKGGKVLALTHEGYPGWNKGS